MPAYAPVRMLWIDESSGLSAGACCSPGAVAGLQSAARCTRQLLVQFGRADGDRFALDFAYPMSAHVAFATALASIDTKLCYAI